MKHNSAYHSYVPHTGCVLLKIALLFSVLSLVTPENLLGAPKARLSSASVDFGKVTGTNIIEKDVIITNVGTDTLELKEVGSSCSCVTVKHLDRTIPAGSDGRAVIVLHPSKAGKGNQQQTVVFSSNDPDQQHLIVGVRWQMGLADLDISPEAIDLDILKKDIRESLDASKSTVLVLDRWQKRLEITDVKTSANVELTYYDILYRCPKGTRIHFFRIEVSLLPNTPVGLLNEWIKLSTNHPQYSTITVPITGQIASTIRITPKILLYRNLVREKTTPVKTITVEAYGESDTLELDQIKAAHPWLVVKQTRVNPKRVDLKVSVQPAYWKSAGEMPKMTKSSIGFKIKKPDVVEKRIDVFLFH